MKGSAKMWEIYDELIEGISDGLTVKEIICGSENTIVINENGAGISVNLICYNTRHPIYSGNLAGASLKYVAKLVKSWNLTEASIGLAAINSYYNSPVVARSAGVEFSDLPYREDRMTDPFITSQNDVKGKKVAVVGHFPYLETFFEPICDLSIIEWEPIQQGDYPFQACEYILPESDFVFLSARSLVDKSFPRLLKLSAGAERVVLVGPITTMAPSLIKWGVDDLSGFIIKDIDRAKSLVSGAEYGKMSLSGQKVSLKRSEVSHEF